MTQEQQKKSRLKIIIIILAVLLAISIAALAGTLLYNRLNIFSPSSVSIPDNIIASDNDKTEENSAWEDNINSNDISSSFDKSSDISNGPHTADESSSNAAQSTSAQKASALYLYNRNPNDNMPFSVGNMFPGDVETKYFCVKVSYKNTITVRFRADIRSGYEKLAEVLKCRMVLLTTGETLYDGLMQNMPESLNHTLTSANSTTGELYYEITAYLDTNVNNEYQNKDLIADFRWWVEETENLESPKTGEEFLQNIIFWSALAVTSFFMIILLMARRRKEDANGQ